MLYIILFILSILPGVFWLWYFYSKDKYKKEPVKVVAKMFFLSAVITIPLALIFGSIVDAFSPAGLIGIFISAFITAALIEEYLKYWMVKKYAFPLKVFDEVFDGIVYAVAASLGFATLENIMYIFFNEGSGISTGIIRAFTAVPSHAFDGALLGYFLGLAQLEENSEKKKKLIFKGLFIAIFFHGFYDFFLFTGNIFFILMVIPLLILQFRFVQVAIKQANSPNPPTKLHLNIKSIFSGLSFFDYIKILFGLALGAFGIFGIMGLTLELLEPDTLKEEGSLTAAILIFIINYLAYLCFFSIWKKKQKLQT